MTSERQKAANQANARRSTGPQTPEGKAVIRLNALRHGLLARDVVLPGEDADAFEDLWNQVRADLSPMGPIEELLSERVVNAIWRLRRLARAETALFHWRVHGLRADRLAKQVRSYEETLLDRLSFPTDITDKASHTEATEALVERLLRANLASAPCRAPSSSRPIDRNAARSRSAPARCLCFARCRASSCIKTPTCAAVGSARVHTT